MPCLRCKSANCGYCPPSCGDEGFYLCEAREYQAELDRAAKEVRRDTLVKRTISTATKSVLQSAIDGAWAIPGGINS